MTLKVPSLLRGANGWWGEKKKKKARLKNVVLSGFRFETQSGTIHGKNMDKIWRE